METRWDTVIVDNDPMPVYVAVPDGPGPFPAVIVMRGQGGVEETFQTLTRRVAEAGFVAAAPELYHRQKDDILEEVKHLPPGNPERSEKLQSKGRRLIDDEMIDDARGAIAHLRTLPQVAADRIGIVGFCQGGRAAYLALTGIDDFVAGVVFYPSSLWTAQGGGPTPFDRSPGIACPVMGVFGNDDRNPSPADVDRLDAELTRLAKPHEFHRYDGAAHDFQNFRSSNYREAQAKDSWPKAMGFLQRHLSLAEAPRT